MSVQAKICGITSKPDADAALRAGADAIGLNMVAGPRRIDAVLARDIAGIVPDGRQCWVLADVSSGDVPAEVAVVLEVPAVTHVQMYGHATGDAIRRIADRGLKSVAVRHVSGAAFADETDDCLAKSRPAVPDMLLLDAGGRQLGGTGRAIDWQMLADLRNAGRFTDWPPLVLAGGLTQENVAEAIRHVQPAWVDVSSGVESAVGIKDAAKMAAFVASSLRA